MNTSTNALAMFLVAGLATAASAAEPVKTTISEKPADICCDQTHAENVHAEVVRMIEAQTFYALPESHRETILARCAEEGIELSFMQTEAEPDTHPVILERSVPLSDDEYAQAFDAVEKYVEEDDFKRFKPIHQRMLKGFAELLENDPHDAPVLPCFTPGTDPALIQAFEAIVFGNADGRFQQTSRWQGTALNPGGAGQGDPTILTYSFPADGTTIPNGVGEGQGPNGLNAFMDGIYGNRATWRALYDQMFDRWGELSGNTYILEPNDDNSTMFNNPGVAGVRGDLRMGGKPIDGNSGILAYNFFPQNGDMVIDSPDSFYNTTSGQSLRLRNVLAHEHGHGMGQLHVCPTSQTKLMEPFISTAYDGPQFDDTLNAQRHYGDYLEPNDSTGDASDLGTLSVGSNIQLGSTGANNSGLTDVLSIDDNNDSDYFLLTLNQGSSITATVTPRGFTYLEGPQTSQCNNGSNYDALNQMNLGIQVLDSNGNVIQSVNDNGTGQQETVLANAASGAAYVRVFGDSSNTIQSYTLNISVDAPVQIPLDLEFIGTPPTLIEPGNSVVITALVELNDDTIIDGPRLVYQRDGDISPTSVDMTGGTGGVYTASLPAFDCGDDPAYFVTVEGSIAGVVTEPELGAIEATIGSGTSIVDNSETDIGWTVTGSATEGQWTRGVPQNNGRSDPPADFDGSGQAWQTGLEANDDNSDVDGGDTVMTSPEFDFSSGGTVSYAYWMNDETNTIGSEDYFRVEVSTNGGSTWTVARDYNPSASWRTDTIDIGAEFGPTSQLRIRFAAADFDPGDVLECAVDAITFESFECDQPDDCLADTNGDGNLDGSDFSAWINAFNNNLPECDQNGDGSCTPADFSAWINNYNAGCP